MDISGSKQDIEWLLNHRTHFVRIPSDLMPHYLTQREADFNRLVALWSPLLVAAFAGCLGFSVVLFHTQLQGRDLQIFAGSEILATLAGMLGLLLARKASWRRNAARWIPWVFGFIIAVKVRASLTMASPLLANNQAYMTLIVLLIGTLALQQSLRASFLGSLLGACAFVWPASASTVQAAPDFPLVFLGQYLLATCVCLFVSLLREDRDRVAFLQSCLLGIEKQEVNRLAGELSAQVSLDSLTGLFNRRHLDASLQAEWERARRNRSELAMLMIDVDHFKLFNDHYGHPAGDACLQQVAQLIRQVAQRPADIAARFGGEEFVVLLPDTPLEGAVELARTLIRLIDELAIPHHESSTSACVTVSIGVASKFPHIQRDGQDLIHAADQALYEAKRCGRHGFAVQDSRAAHERAA